VLLPFTPGEAAVPDEVMEGGEMLVERRRE
jgi:hypothetical protein